MIVILAQFAPFNSWDISNLFGYVYAGFLARIKQPRSKRLTLNLFESSRVLSNHVCITKRRWPIYFVRGDKEFFYLYCTVFNLPHPKWACLVPRAQLRCRKLNPSVYFRITSLLMANHCAVIFSERNCRVSMTELARSGPDRESLDDHVGFFHFLLPESQQLFCSSLHAGWNHKCYARYTRYHLPKFHFTNSNCAHDVSMLNYRIACLLCV